MTRRNEKALECLAGQNEGESTENRTKEPINLQNTTSVTSATERVTTTPKAQAWLDAHPNWADEPVSNVLRAGFTEQELDSLFERLRTVPATATVSTAAGFVVQPGSLLMRSICNGDNGPSAARSRYLINAGAAL